MSSEVSEARARARAREVERERARQQRKDEAQAQRKSRSRSGSQEVEDDPKHDPMVAAGWDRKADRARQAERANESATGSGGVFAPTSHPPSREDQVLTHAANLQAENAATLRHTIKVARETTQVGAATIHKLNEQTEQFQRMDNTLTETEDSLSRSERIIRGMKSFGGAFANLFSSDKPKPDAHGAASAAASSRATPEASTAALDEKDRQRALRKETEAARAKHLNLDDYANRASPDSFAPHQTPPGGASSAAAASARPVVPPNARQAAALQTLESNQRAEDSALEELSDVLGALKEQSQIMNQQLSTQAKMLDGIESKVDNTSARLQKGTRTMAKIT